MHFDLPTVSLIFITACVCLVGFIGVVTLYVVSIKKGRKEGDRLIKDIERFAQDNKDSVPIATRFLIGIYVLISLCALGSIVFLTVAGLAHEAGLPFANNINVESLGFISGAVLLVAILAALTLRLLFRKIFKSR